MESFEKLAKLIKSFEGQTCTKNDIDEALTLLISIKEYTKLRSEGIVRYINVNDLDPKWTEVGYGHFGYVYSSKYGGSKVAIKIFKEESKSKIQEGKILYSLSHENIIAFRGIGYITEQKAKDLKIVTNEQEGEMMFIVMEFIDQNLLRYVDGMKVHERKGLPYDMAWTVGQQIASALSYLHALDITHRDLKPDNILLEVGPKRVVVKLADFGLAVEADQINKNPPHEKMMSSSRTSSYYGANVRWGAPEVFNEGHVWSLDNIKAADIYCFGNVLAFTLTGERPHEKTSTFTLKDRPDLQQQTFSPELPKSLTGSLKSAVFECLAGNPGDRPTAADVLINYFSSDRNPYLIQTESEKEVEFFTCGFMDKTDIFVADSCTDKEASQMGFYESGTRPTGYDHSDLLCPIEVEKAPYRDKPDEWDLEEDYNDNFDKFQKLSKQKVIDNNPTVALKGLTFARPGDEECQLIEFTFKQSDYVHHRAMRDIWIAYNAKQKIEELPCKADVHPYFSNTFGLHVAILTNEGPDKPQKFLFPRRAQREGMSAPGKYTCGAVESASKPDYFKHGDKTSVNLVHTAARGLQEELGLELTGDDMAAICLTTVYLKFDTHEWGLCGFVDLKDERIAPNHRLSAESLKDIFSTGPKDKFEHQTLTFVDFDLRSMVDFVFNNHENFASSAKLVVVKVLQAFYGWQRVQKEFEMRMFGQ